MARTVTGLDEVRSLEGELLGISTWRTISQGLVNGFADVSDDHQFIHVDAELAKAGPFGRTIAHGFLILSLAPSLLREIVEFDGMTTVVNIGLNRVRFARPVPVGEQVRMSAAIIDVEELGDGDGSEVVLKLTYEVQGAKRPACVAELILRLMM